MEILRKTKGINTCYELRPDPSEAGDSYALEMLCNNRFATLPELTMQWVDGERRLMYKTDGMTDPVRKWGPTGPGWRDVMKLLFCLSDCIRELQDFLLPTEGVLLSLAYLFWDEQRRRILFLYAPGRKADFSEEMKHLMEELMPIFNHGNENEILRFYDLYGLLLNGSFTPEMLLNLTDSWKNVNDGDRPGIAEREAYGNHIEGKSAALDESAKNVYPRLYGSEHNMPDEWSKAGTEKQKENEQERERLTERPGMDRSKEKWIFAGIGALILLTAVVSYMLFGSSSIRISVLLVAGYLLFLICRFFFGDGHSSAGGKEADESPEDRNRTFGPAYGEALRAGTRVEPAYGEAFGAGTRVEPAYREAFGTGSSGGPYLNGANEAKSTALVPVTSVLRNSIRQLVPVERGLRAPLYVSEGYCRIGRSEEENEYCIPSPSISRSHARLECCGNVVTLQDLGSTNGTYINHVRITDSFARELHYGDVVSFAGVEYYVV